jgi:E1A/CREB-binding protein
LKRPQDTYDATIQKLRSLLKEKDIIISDLQINLDYLENIIKDIDQTERVVNGYDETSRRYSTSVKTGMYEILQHNVSVSNIPAVIECVLNLVNVKPNRLPSRSTIIDMNLQRLFVSKTCRRGLFETVLTDETSKFGARYMGYEASGTDGNLWVLELRDIETKSADNTLKVFKEIFSDLNDISDSENDPVSRDIIKHICATLSDRAATEMKFNNLLESYRKDVLPLIYLNYDTLSDNEKQQLETLCNFFCGLHSLVNLAGVAQSSALQVETALFNGRGPIHGGDFLKDTEPGSCR